jgi:prepilin-type N-terminal cleavage/methylation domain-containing protein
MSGMEKNQHRTVLPVSRPRSPMGLGGGTGPQKAFTLFEVILALMILGLLSGAVYSITAAALESTRAAMNEQTGARRLEAFVRITRDALLNLPSDARIFLRIGKSSTGAPVPELVFAETSGTFGIASLGGGSIILSARPRADGTRAFSILRVPANVQGVEYDRLMAQGGWIPLLSGVEKVAWTFFKQGKWQEEWPEGAGRPESVRLSFEYIDLPGSVVDLQFWIPPLVPPQQAPPPNAPPGTPGTPGTPGQPPEPGVNPPPESEPPPEPNEP